MKNAKAIEMITKNIDVLLKDAMGLAVKHIRCFKVDPEVAMLTSKYLNTYEVAKEVAIGLAENADDQAEMTEETQREIKGLRKQMDRMTDEIIRLRSENEQILKLLEELKKAHVNPYE